MASIPPGSDFNELKSSYVIFICTFDPFGEGLYQYTFENVCKENGMPLGDGTTKIFLNSKGKNPQDVTPELIHLLQYAENSTDECVAQLQDENVYRIHDRVKSLKKSRDWEGRYMRFDELLQNAEKHGIEAGIESGTNRLLALIEKMSEAGEGESVVRLSKEPEFLQQMYEKYQV